MIAANSPKGFLKKVMQHQVDSLIRPGLLISWSGFACTINPIIVGRSICVVMLGVPRMSSEPMTTSVQLHDHGLGQDITVFGACFQMLHQENAATQGNFQTSFYLSLSGLEGDCQITVPSCCRMFSIRLTDLS